MSGLYLCTFYRWNDVYGFCDLMLNWAKIINMISFVIYFYCGMILLNEIWYIVKMTCHIFNHTRKTILDVERRWERFSNFTGGLHWYFWTIYCVSPVEKFRLPLAYIPTFGPGQNILLALNKIFAVQCP